MKYILVVLCVSILMIKPTVAQFQECNSPTIADLHDVNFINENTGVAVGDSGTIIRTTDGGLNWDLVMVNDSISFRKVKFFNDLNGISIGSDIFITENGGMSWMPIENDNDYYNDVEILNDSTCLLSCLPNGIIKSSNYGVDWEVIVSDTLDYNFQFLSFFDENNGYASHWTGSITSSMLKTQDGGKNWTEIEDGSGEHITIIEDISFISEEVGFRGGWYNAHLMKTQNSSGYWEATELPDSTTWAGFGIFDFHIESSLPNSFYACGWYGDIFKSTDEGNNWMELNSGVGDTILLGIYFINDNIGWVVGQYGKIMKTNSEGEIVGTNEINENPSVFVAPNPSNGSFIIQSNLLATLGARIDLYSITGQLVFSQKVNRITDNFQIEIMDLAKGSYILTVQDEKDIVSEKLVIH